MQKKIVPILVSMLFIFSTISITVFAGSEEDPEIEDEIGDAFGYIDIQAVWFYEKSDEPDILYVCMKINNALSRIDGSGTGRRKSTTWNYWRD